MNREHAIKSAIRAKLEMLGERLAGYKVVLFGSRATGSQRERSDFDIGVLGDKPLPIRTLSDVEDSLDSIETLYSIEVVDLQRASDGFRREATKKFEVLYG